MPEPTGTPLLSHFAKAHLEEIRDAYNEKRSPLLWAARCYRQWLAHYYNLLIREGATVLEVGCGEGDLLERLHTRNITEIDVAENRVEAARGRLPHGCFHVQAGEEINLPGTFEYIILSDSVRLPVLRARYLR
jgi:2-polyprenyl-3-methyl-5-hydroxy-6-metoxy-1,4-benzoquinol methylase